MRRFQHLKLYSVAVCSFQRSKCVTLNENIRPKRLCLKTWDPSQIVEKHFKSLEILKVSVKESSHCQSLTKKSV